jgi:hypothetical protein
MGVIPRRRRVDEAPDDVWPPPRIIDNPPTISVAQALANSQKQCDAAK